jgi:protein-S-isoprenylcysteine O-methyltransferase Ste14
VQELRFEDDIRFTLQAGARWYEEPRLFHTFGAEYDTYRRAVPGWWPRLRPWQG